MNYETNEADKLLMKINKIKEVSEGYGQHPEDLLQNPNLFHLIDEEFAKQIKGEQKSRRAIFLSLCNVWCDGENPINTFVSSESSAGKSFVCKKIIKLFPKEMVQYRTKITPEVFTYWHSGEDKWTWDGKICYLEDVSQAILESSTFKVMCSEGSTASVLVKQKVIDIEIKGKPVMLVTSARTNPSTEILNRFNTIPLDESDKQTEEIVFSQALNSQSGEVNEFNPVFTEALRLLERKKVLIPFAVQIAEYLKKNYNFSKLRIRRDFERLLSLIKSCAVLHQKQRESKSEGQIIATLQDYEFARECINYFQSNTFLSLTHKLSKAYTCCLELKRFTAKEIHSKFPMVSQKMWYLYLDQLSERGLLTTELVKVEGVKQHVTYFLVQDKSTFSLPSFEMLQPITKVTSVTRDTNVTLLTNDNQKSREEEKTFVSNVTNVMEKSKGESIDFSELDGVFNE